ncbi:MAG: hypothetical protein Q4D13_07095 [Erysipelotrichaceae bacterium]|nr:hypothetical protein [Erysipelotrichaceae bacterium]
MKTCKMKKLSTLLLCLFMIIAITGCNVPGLGNIDPEEYVTVTCLEKLDFTNGKDLNSVIHFYGPDGDGEYRYDEPGFDDYSVISDNGDIFYVEDESYKTSAGYTTVLRVIKNDQEIGTIRLGMHIDEAVGEINEVSYYQQEFIEGGFHNGDKFHVDLVPDDDLKNLLLEEGLDVLTNDEQIEVTGLGDPLDAEIVFNENDRQQLIANYLEYLDYRAGNHSNIDVYYATLKPETVIDPQVKSDKLILFLSDQGQGETSLSHIWLYNIYRDSDGQIKGEYGSPVSTDLDYVHTDRQTVLDVLSKSVDLSRID